MARLEERGKLRAGNVLGPVDGKEVVEYTGKSPHPTRPRVSAIRK